MKRLSLLVLLLLVFPLSACSGDSPEAGMREWLEASFQMKGTKLAERTCNRMIPMVQNMGAMLSGIVGAGQLIARQDLNLQSDLSGLRFETVSSSGNSARVRVRGEIRIAIMAMFQVVRVDYTADMVLEDNRWKWCGP